MFNYPDAPTEGATTTVNGVLMQYVSGRWTLAQASTPPVATQAEMEAGAETAVRAMTPQGVAQAIAKSIYQDFTVSGTWTKPVGPYSTVYVVITGGGASGASGCRRASGTATSGGAGGPSGGIHVLTMPYAQAPATAAIIVGAEAAGGASVTTNDTDGNSGIIGSPSKFGTFQAVSGTAAQGGKTTAATGGSAAGGTYGSSAGDSSVVGGTPPTLHSIGTPQAGGGGAGGGISATPTAYAGGNGGKNGINTVDITITQAMGGAIGTAGDNGYAADSFTSGVAMGTIYSGSAGAGGGSSITGAAGAGGNGGNYGAPGGGGGSSLNGYASGAGGNGSQGRVQVWVW